MTEVTETPSRHPERLVLIDGDKAEDARKLVATWSLIGERLENGRYGTGAEADHETMLVEWERISLVDRSDIVLWEPVLFENGILGPGGFVDPDALVFIKGYVGASLRKRNKSPS